MAHTASNIELADLVDCLAALEKHEREDLYRVVEQFVEAQLEGEDPIVTKHLDGSVSVVTLADLIGED